MHRSYSGMDPNIQARKWADADMQGWAYRHGDAKDETLVKNAGKLAFYKNGRVYVSSKAIADRVDRGLMIREG